MATRRNTWMALICAIAIVCILWGMLRPYRMQCVSREGFSAQTGEEINEQTKDSINLPNTQATAPANNQTSTQTTAPANNQTSTQTTAQLTAQPSTPANNQPTQTTTQTTNQTSTQVNNQSKPQPTPVEPSSNSSIAKPESTNAVVTSTPATVQGTPISPVPVATPLAKDVPAVKQDTTSQVNKNKTTEQPKEQKPATALATPWSCEKIQHWNPTSYTDAYVISRKKADGTPQCWNIKGTKTDLNDKCTVYANADQCKLALMTTEETPISTCSDEECYTQKHTCNQLNRGIWQCHLIDKENNLYHALRKNEDKNIECLGHSVDSCIPFNSLMSCMQTAPTVNNDKYLSCGKMMFQLFNTDGYSYPDHYCAKFKDIVK